MPDDIDLLLDQSRAELEAKTAAHQAWGLGSEESWEFDQDSGLLRFIFPDRVVTAPAQIVGTFVPPVAGLGFSPGNWRWSWANDSIDESLTADARTLRAFGETHREWWLTDPAWEGGDEQAWETAALAVKLNGRQGAYRGPAGDSYVFFTFGDIAISPR